MDPDPDRTVGYTDLSGKSDSHPAAPVIVATPAVTRPGAGPSSAMVTRSRARGGREINVDPEVEFGPEMEFLPEAEIPAETDEGVSGATRHFTDIASQEVAITQEVRTSASITTSTLPPIPRNPTPHTCVSNYGFMITLDCGYYDFNISVAKVADINPVQIVFSTRRLVNYWT